MNKQDKLRLYFTWRDKLYEKWIDLDYPNNIPNNSEHQQAYIIDLGMNTMIKWYKEVTGEDYPDNTIKVREMTYNDKTTPEEMVKRADEQGL